MIFKKKNQQKQNTKKKPTKNSACMNDMISKCEL